jgi:peroxiredoxin
MTTIFQGRRAPHFALTDASGSAFDLSVATREGPIVLAFFKVSCPVCQFSFPFLERLHRAYGQGQAHIWGISQDDLRDTQCFFREFNLTFPALVDAEGYAVSNLYGLTNVPTILLVGSNGLVQVSFTGFDRAGILKISDLLAKAATKKPHQVFRPGEQIPDYKPG